MPTFVPLTMMGPFHLKFPLISTLPFSMMRMPVPVLSPEIAATLAATFELGCSVLLIAGLATRLATLPLLGMILTIQLFVYPGAYSEHLTWASILIFLLTRGAGPWSLDRPLGLEPRESTSR